jgi:DNA-binding FadR family transcriptional regulator
MRAKRFADTLPSENQLAAAAGISRLTARNVMAEFKAEGRVDRVPRQGDLNEENESGPWLAIPMVRWMW